MLKIVFVQSDDTMLYAAQELKKYILQMSRATIVPQLCPVDRVSAVKEAGSIVLGTLEELGLDQSDLEDPFMEDIMDISVENGEGYIAGSNPRSILMGVYQYCTSAGCRFIRPGENGDYVPRADLYHHTFIYRKKADYLFRGECCEGAISYEHMRDTVYWLPKIGMNMYMIEGLVPYTYMHKWYGHVSNLKLRPKGQVTNHQMLWDYVRLLEQDVKKAGLQLHTLGHGWMFKKQGITGGPASMQQAALTDEDRQYLALVEGKRDLYHNSAFFTHYCYSNPKARRVLIDNILEYIEEKPFVDYIHVWLADAVNNHCECEECQKRHPSDHYVCLLNELDEALTEIGSQARLVFIGYTDTERPPQELTLNNPRRFVFLSAIGGHYEKGYKKVCEAPMGEIPEYQRNAYKAAPDTVRFYWKDQWKKLCGNIPNVIYEYRYYTDMYCDLGHMQLSRETCRDMKDLAEVGIEGCMSDQTHRMYMPTALPMITMGKMLFDRNRDYEEVAEEYFEGAFGEESKACRAYLEKLSVLLCPSNFRVGGKNGVEEEGLGALETRLRSWIGNPEVAQKAAQIPQVLDDFLTVIEKRIGTETDPARRLSWIYLKHHSYICRYFGAILLAGAQGDMEEAKARFAPLREYLSEHEMEFHNVFDLFLYTRAVTLKLGLPVEGYYD